MIFSSDDEIQKELHEAFGRVMRKLEKHERLFITAMLVESQKGAANYEQWKSCLQWLDGETQHLRRSDNPAAVVVDKYINLSAHYENMIQTIDSERAAANYLRGAGLL